MIFISGSRSISEYDVVQQYLSEFKLDHVLVGDCYGVDYQVQTYCLISCIPYTVYYCGLEPRCYRESKYSTLKRVPNNNQTMKDIKMSIDCDSGIVIWNSKSKGSWNNYCRLKDMHKPVTLIKVD
jgi:hypothetical protein